MSVIDDIKSRRASLVLLLDKSSILNNLKLLATFMLAFLIASAWVIILVFSNFSVLVATYNKMAQPSFAGGLSLFDVTRLVAKWGFYSGAFGMPYIPYRNVYLSIPWFAIVCFVPAMLAFASLFLYKKLKITLFFGIVAVVSLVLSSGFSFSGGNQLYLAIMDFFMLRAFREASNWMFFVVFSFAILIGCTVSALTRRSKRTSLKIILVCLVAALLLSSSYPLSTGDVGRNWLDPNIKGSYLPSSYSDLNAMLSDQHWAIVVGDRSTYLIYNFSQGPFGCGNPYPLIFSNPLVTGVGTEYVQSQNTELVSKVEQVMLTDQNIAGDGKVSASSVEDNRYMPYEAVDGSMLTRWSSNSSMPQWIKVDWSGIRQLSKVVIHFESAYASDYSIETWDGSSWTTEVSVINNTSVDVTHSFANVANATELLINFTRATDRFPSVSIWELEIYAIRVPKFLDALGVDQLIVEKDLMFGGSSNPDDLSLSRNENFVMVKDWNEVALYNTTHALDRLYIANDSVPYVTLDDMSNAAENIDWSYIDHTVFLNSSSTPNMMNKTLVLPSSFTWEETSPTTYEAKLQSAGPFFLVFLESYDPAWKLFVNGNPISDTLHVKANAYANAWLVDVTGAISVSLQYEPQNMLRSGIVVSIVLSTAFLIFIGRDELLKYLRLTYIRFNRLGFSMKRLRLQPRKPLNKSFRN